MKQINGADFAVLSADSEGLISYVNEYCIQNNMPYINIGYVNDIAVWGPMVIPGVTGCFYCHTLVANSSPKDEMYHYLATINNEYQAPSTAGINMLASSNALMDIIKYLGDFGDIHSINKRIGLWTHNLSIEEQNCSKNPNCKVCGK